MIETLSRPTASQQFYMFPVPRRLGKKDRLKTLSGNAIRLYLFLVYRMFKGFKSEMFITDLALARDLKIEKDHLKAIRCELHMAELITYKVVDETRIGYTLLNDIRPEFETLPTPREPIAEI
jgi:hypothetical protein